MEEIEKNIEKLVLGELDDQKAKEILDQINEDPSLRKIYEAHKTSHASFEFGIAESLRKEFGELKPNQPKEHHKPKTKALYIVGIAATLLILILSVTSINLSHNDSSIAKAYHINSVTLREEIEADDKKMLSEAVRAYYLNDLSTSKSILDGYEPENELTKEYSEWLKVLLSLRTEGSNSETFKNAFNHILNNKGHAFHSDAQKMQNQLSNFWRTFIVKK